jgi:hypothetical protein
MESTGVYWIALYEILEQRGFEPCWSTPTTDTTCVDASAT